MVIDESSLLAFQDLVDGSIVRMDSAKKLTVVRLSSARLSFACSPVITVPLVEWLFLRIDTGRTGWRQKVIGIP